ncbi:MAG: flagellar basal body L-ring protein FlgH [Asticcacaulis sp.]|jgi:flagellar L-ring protein precursor FlgH|uniref:flagellar basal body L-ring protein FlgH n=1 Tax=Asticcacaulis sp. TaxID=1872648 RepID=UPI0025B82FA2|nr:flagellar basal body L-ring protein FlgH [Asticcacaulis sp.]MCA1936797.1 flagellar basal body L-ring protein FlgH [Asticcacaulis sp.]
MRFPVLVTVAALTAAALSGCASVNEAVNGPSLQPMGYPAQLVPQQQVYAAPASTSASANSLWRTGAKAFFKDQRARHVGDILTVTIDIDDKAQTQNTTSRKRDGSYTGSIPKVFGLESSLGKILPSEYNAAAGLSNNTAAEFSGSGSVNRSEKISLTVAAIVTGVLPNGNLIIQGSQEVRTNREVRELIVSGIVNPQDISSANIIKHTQLAEARISYGGRGDVSRMQAAPVSQNLMEKFSPF